MPMSSWVSMGMCVLIATVGAGVLQPACVGAQDGAFATVDDAPATIGLSITQVLKFVNEQGIEAVDATLELDHGALRELRSRMAGLGGESPVLIRVNDQSTLVGVTAASGAARTMIAESFGRTLQFRTIVIVPSVCAEADWDALVDLLGRHDGTVTRSEGLVAARTLASLAALRELISRHHEESGLQPDFRSLQWRALESLVPAPMMASNPISACADTTRIAVIREPGADGTTVGHTEAGWVWNDADARLYPAGVTEAMLRELIAERDHRIFRAAARGTESMRRHVLRSQLSSLRARVDELIAASASTGTSFPSLAALRDAGAETPTNPFNGSREIQSAVWDDGAAPIGGSAGWNYDASTGRLWANCDCTTQD